MDFFLKYIFYELYLFYNFFHKLDNLLLFLHSVLIDDNK